MGDTKRGRDGEHEVSSRVGLGETLAGPRDEGFAVPEAGTVLSDRYVVEGELGRGGMGVVLRVLDRWSGQRVALKLLHPALAASEEGQARFRREVFSCRELGHPGIVRVYDLGIAGAQQYYTMALVEGRPLRSLLGERARWLSRPLAERVRLFAALCDAVHHAHERGLVHRDLKPENVMVRPDGTPCLMDFGLTRALRGSSGLTRAAQALGTAYYLAPEQLRGTGETGPAADVYSMGILLYELLVGEAPMPGYGSPSEEGAGVPAALDAVYARAVRRRPEERYATAAELGAAAAAGLSPAAAAAPASAAPARPAPPPPRAAPARPAPAVHVPPAPKGWVRIEPGVLTMGSPEGEGGRNRDETPHRVRLTRPFLLQATPVTQGQFQELLGVTPSRFSDLGPSQPVECVSFWDAVAYCNALSRKEGLDACYELSGPSGTVGRDFECKDIRWKGPGCPGYRLPTEAEWEYACRAGTTGPRYGALDEIAWHEGNSGGTTHAVGQLAPNAWGLHDMLGNVWEWCWDRYGSYPPGESVDPVGPDAGSGRVNRGGSWLDSARIARAAYRYWLEPGIRCFNLGFRPARSG